jgi:kynureninase
LFPAKGRAVYEQLFAKGFMVDWREPNVIRLAPVPLYNSFTEIWQFSEALKEILQELFSAEGPSGQIK